MNPLSLSPTASAVRTNWSLRQRGFDAWLLSYLLGGWRRKRPRKGEPVDLLLCIADHFEPKRGHASPEVAADRVECWARDYPSLFGDFRDSDGHPPRHTFFFPQEEYVPQHLNALTRLCRAGFGEVEVHLHHDRDTPDGLRAKLEWFKHTLTEQHGQLARHRDTGDLAYAFIHGNWALDNARPDGRCCGVNNELDVLRETGCYADFTMPSFPAIGQTRKINSIYYAVDDPMRPKSHDTGFDAGHGPPPPKSLLMIQGPLVLDWGRRKCGVIPRVENGCLQGNQSPSMHRLDLWLKARVQMPSRPDWFFVKLYTHGAHEPNRAVLLGDPMVSFHRALERRAMEDPAFRYHYVTAREMYNLVLAAQAGWKGDVESARDYELIWNGGCSTSRRDIDAMKSAKPIGA